MCEAVEQWLADAREDGIEHGIQQERARGAKERKLFQLLVHQERYADLNRALAEDTFRQQLILEYAL